MANNKITIYTDGAAQGNPGRGGYGVVLLSPPYRKELSEGFRLTTNNRMELLAVIKGLETLKFEAIQGKRRDSKRGAPQPSLRSIFPALHADRKHG